MLNFAKLITCIIFVSLVIALIYSSRYFGYQDAQTNNKNIVQRSKNGYNIIIIDPYDTSTHEMERLFDDAYNVMLFHHESRLILEAWK